jgi:hypothetical protein
MKFYDVERRLNPLYAESGSTLDVACFVDGFLEYHPITWNDVIVDDGEHDHIDMKSAPTGSSRQRGDGECTEQRSSNDVSLCPTSNHRMFVRVGDTYADRSGGPGQWRHTHATAPPLMIHTAGDVYAAGQKGPLQVAEFLSVFEHGRRDAAVPDLFHQLGLVTEDQIEAFLCLYGTSHASGAASQARLLTVFTEPVPSVCRLIRLCFRLLARRWQPHDGQQDIVLAGQESRRRDGRSDTGASASRASDVGHARRCRLVARG